MSLTGTTIHSASAGEICLQSHDRAFTSASTEDHPIPQTGSVLKSQRDRLHPATPRWTIDSRNVQMPNALKMTRYSSLSLTEIVCICADGGSDEAWQEFLSRVGKPISLTIMRTASRWGQPSRTLVEDL